MKKNKRLKIFGTPWHVAHNYSLCMALEPIADFDFLINYTRRWDDKNREFPKNGNWVTHFEKGKYDLCILHIDQQCSNLALNKSNLTIQMKKAIREVDKDVPIIFINHGTPVYPESYPDGVKENNFISEQLKKEILDMVAPDFMVVNSHQAKIDWNYANSRTIIHGMNAKEWVYNEEKEPRSATFISPAGIGDKYYNRSFLVDVMEVLSEKYGISHQWVNTPNCFNAHGIKEYKEFLGKTLVYFNPTFASPMPRSRTEAMLSGCCVVSTAPHGFSDFITDGVDGFIVPMNDVQYTAKLIDKLIKNYKIAKEIGKRGRETALKLFNRERYQADWIKLLKDLKIL
jgi:glycosyltransferase involved in cell wall biosynthesis